MGTTFSKDNNRQFSYIAFFDLDQTITNSISGKALAKGAYRKGLMTHWDLLNAIFLSFVFRFNLKDPLKIIDNMVSWVKGIPEKTMDDLCSEVFHEVLLPSVYKEAKAEIESHKTRNAKVVLLSSALTYICQKMANYLGIDDILCSELEIKNGYLTGRPVGHLCFGDEKAVRLMAYCDKNMYSASDAWYYGDSISDFSALKAVGNPVCINPDKKLRKEAVKRAWEILTWEN
jgi:putative phosphoserine phosphatase/1-acylglycerol-3-phosphate O-acyltransferase